MNWGEIIFGPCATACMLHCNAEPCGGFAFAWLVRGLIVNYDLGSLLIKVKASRFFLFSPSPVYLTSLVPWSAILWLN